MAVNIKANHIWNVTSCMYVGVYACTDVSKHTFTLYNYVYVFRYVCIFMYIFMETGEILCVSESAAKWTFVYSDI